MSTNNGTKVIRVTEAHEGGTASFNFTGDTRTGKVVRESIGFTPDGGYHQDVREVEPRLREGLVTRAAQLRASVQPLIQA